MIYPGLLPDVKSYLWRTVGLPSLTYGINCINFSASNLSMLESTQGRIIKHILGLSKYAHHSKLLAALHVPPVAYSILFDTVNLLKRIFAVPSCYRSLCAHFIFDYISRGVTTPGTLVDRIVTHNLSPLESILHFRDVQRVVRGRVAGLSPGHDGLVDSLAALLRAPDFNVRSSNSHKLFRLLTAVAP